MSPIDRVALRSQAFDILGIPANSTKSDIRRAYKKLAKEKHPDQHPECGSEFAQITEAYQALREHADELNIEDCANDPAPASVSPRRVSRPNLRASESEFTEAERKECQALLNGYDGGDGRYVANAVYRVGRKLTFLVREPMAKGMNLVVVPTGMLHDARRVMPRLLSFHSRDAVGGFYEMPDQECVEHFPGARQVQIRFISD
ncbi:MAG: J domain-containing protein [Paracoccaceae bacterium]|nr:J domain-containing protein [Paracoccaceae bacterium]